MGLYRRKDSPFWWMQIDGTGHRCSTGVLVHGGSPAQDRELHRQALTIYAAKQTEAARYEAGLAPKPLPAIGFAEWAHWYEVHHAQHHRAAHTECSMIRRLGVHFNHFTTLADIDATQIREWMTQRAKQVKPATVNRELDVLKCILRAAVPKYLATSPAGDIRRLRIPESEPRVLTRDEEGRLLAAGDVHDRAWLLTALDTLLRLSSVVHLRWDQVKLDHGVIVPLNAKVSHDAVPITTRLDFALRQLTRPSDWVFDYLHRGHGPSAAKNIVTRRFEHLCAVANVPHGRDVHGVTFHCLRHTGATRALQNGASVRTVMKLGGWRTESMVMRYVHAADSDVRAAAESIGLHLVPKAAG